MSLPACPRCSEATGRPVNLKLIQLNFKEAMWQCKNDKEKCSYPLLEEDVDVTAFVVPRSFQKIKDDPFLYLPKQIPESDRFTPTLNGRASGLSDEAQNLLDSEVEPQSHGLEGLELSDAEVDGTVTVLVPKTDKMITVSQDVGAISDAVINTLTNSRTVPVSGVERIVAADSNEEMPVSTSEPIQPLLVASDQRLVAAQTVIVNPRESANASDQPPINLEDYTESVGMATILEVDGQQICLGVEPLSAADILKAGSGFQPPSLDASSVLHAALAGPETSTGEPGTIKTVEKRRSPFRPDFEAPIPPEAADMRSLGDVLSDSLTPLYSGVRKCSRQEDRMGVGALSTALGNTVQLADFLLSAKVVRDCEKCGDVVTERSTISAVTLDMTIDMDFVAEQPRLKSMACESCGEPIVGMLSLTRLPPFLVYHFPDGLRLHRSWQRFLTLLFKATESGKVEHEYRLVFIGLRPVERYLANYYVCNDSKWTQQTHNELARGRVNSGSIIANDDIHTNVRLDDIRPQDIRLLVWEFQPDPPSPSPPPQLHRLSSGYDVDIIDDDATHFTEACEPLKRPSKSTSLSRQNSATMDKVIDLVAGIDDGGQQASDPPPDDTVERASQSDGVGLGLVCEIKEKVGRPSVRKYRPKQPPVCRAGSDDFYDRETVHPHPAPKVASSRTTAKSGRGRGRPIGTPRQRSAPAKTTRDADGIAGELAKQTKVPGEKAFAEASPQLAAQTSLNEQALGAYVTSPDDGPFQHEDEVEIEIEQSLEPQPSTIQVVGLSGPGPESTTKKVADQSAAGKAAGRRKSSDRAPPPPALDLVSVQPSTPEATDSSQRVSDDISPEMGAGPVPLMPSTPPAVLHRPQQHHADAFSPSTLPRQDYNPQICLSRLPGGRAEPDPLYRRGMPRSGQLPLPSGLVEANSLSALAQMDVTRPGLPYGIMGRSGPCRFPIRMTNNSLNTQSFPISPLHQGLPTLQATVPGAMMSPLNAPRLSATTTFSPHLSTHVVNGGPVGVPHLHGSLTRGNYQSQATASPVTVTGPISALPNPASLVPRQTITHISPSAARQGPIPHPPRRGRPQKRGKKTPEPILPTLPIDAPPATEITSIDVTIDEVRRRVTPASMYKFQPGRSMVQVPKPHVHIGMIPVEDILSYAQRMPGLEDIGRRLLYKISEQAIMQAPPNSKYPRMVGNDSPLIAGPVTVPGQVEGYPSRCISQAVTQVQEPPGPYFGSPSPQHFINIPDVLPGMPQQRGSVIVNAIERPQLQQNISPPVPFQLLPSQLDAVAMQARELRSLAGQSVAVQQPRPTVKPRKLPQPVHVSRPGTHLQQTDVHASPLRSGAPPGPHHVRPTGETRQATTMALLESEMPSTRSAHTLPAAQPTRQAPSQKNLQSQRVRQPSQAASTLGGRQGVANGPSYPGIEQSSTSHDVEPVNEGLADVGADPDDHLLGNIIDEVVEDVQRSRRNSGRRKSQKGATRTARLVSTPEDPEPVMEDGSQKAGPSHPQLVVTVPADPSGARYNETRIRSDGSALHTADGAVVPLPKGARIEIDTAVPASPPRQLPPKKRGRPPRNRAEPPAQEPAELSPPAVPPKRPKSKKSREPSEAEKLKFLSKLTFPENDDDFDPDLLSRIVSEVYKKYQSTKASDLARELTEEPGPSAAPVVDREKSPEVSPRPGSSASSRSTGSRHEGLSNLMSFDKVYSRKPLDGLLRRVNEHRKFDGSSTGGFAFQRSADLKRFRGYGKETVPDKRLRDTETQISLSAVVEEKRARIAQEAPAKVPKSVSRSISNATPVSLHPDTQPVSESVQDHPSTSTHETPNPPADEFLAVLSPVNPYPGFSETQGQEHDQHPENPLEVLQHALQSAHWEGGISGLGSDQIDDFVIDNSYGFM